MSPRHINPKDLLLSDEERRKVEEEIEKDTQKQKGNISPLVGKRKLVVKEEENV